MTREEELKKMIALADGKDLERLVSILHNEIRQGTLNKDFYYYGQNEYFANRSDNRRFKKYETGYNKLDIVAKPRAGHVTLIPAYTKHGKSIFCMNLCYNMFFKHKDTNIIYYSFESNNFEVCSFLSRMFFNEHYERKHPEIKKLTHFEWDEQRRIKCTEAWNYDNIAIDQFEKRIFCRDERVDTTQVATHLRRVIDDKGNVGIVFIDYMQDMKINERTGEHHADIEQLAIEVDRLASEYGIAVIAPAQYGRWSGKGLPQSKWDIIGEHRIFGSASLAKKADVMYSLFNKSIFELNTHQANGMDSIQDIEIDVLVSRGQNYGTDLKFTFDRDTFRINECAEVQTGIYND